MSDIKIVVKTTRFGSVASAQQVMRRVFGIVITQKQDKCEVYRDGKLLYVFDVDFLGLNTSALIESVWCQIKAKHQPVYDHVVPQPAFFNLSEVDKQRLLRDDDVEHVEICRNFLSSLPSSCTRFLREFDSAKLAVQRYIAVTDAIRLVYNQNIELDETSMIDYGNIPTLTSKLSNMGEIVTVEVDNESLLPALQLVKPNGRLILHDGKKYYTTTSYSVWTHFGGVDEISLDINLDVLISAEEQEKADVVIAIANESDLVNAVASALSYPGKVCEIKDEKPRLSMSASALRGLAGCIGTGKLSSCIKAGAEYLRNKYILVHPGATHEYGDFEQVAAHRIANMYSARRVELRDGEWYLVMVEEEKE